MKTVPQLSIVSAAFLLTTLACKGSASQDNATASMDSMSALERQSAPAQAGYRAPEYRARRTGTSQSTGTHVEKNGGRDAAIGAGAGAILGAVTSKDKVKGAVIGGAAGGILGGVIGNNVDKKTVPNPR